MPGKSGFRDCIYCSADGEPKRYMRGLLVSGSGYRREDGGDLGGCGAGVEVI